MTFTHENVSMGVCCIQDAIDVPKTEYGKQLIYMYIIETWNCVLGKGMNNQMFDLLNIQVFIVRWIVQFLWMDMKSVHGC